MREVLGRMNGKGLSPRMADRELRDNWVTYRIEGVIMDGERMP